LKDSLQDLGTDPDIFVPLDSYKPGKIYFDHVCTFLPKIWRLKQDYFWTYVIAPKASQLVQGWKIHVSTIPQSALRVLEKVVTVCVAHEVELKFASDGRILNQLLAKICARQSSGKFITIYPGSIEKFKAILEDLYPLLRDENGPYILSDRQYKDSKVLFYRYGGFYSFTNNKVDGTVEHTILDKEYGFIEDERSPYFSLPGFVVDEFDRSGSHTTLKTKYTGEKKDNALIVGGKYQIDSVIVYSNAGGVYKAKNIETDECVILKEARPFVLVDKNGVDTIGRLEKEFRILSTLSGLSIGPKAIDCFTEWNHSFLVQEFIEGQNLFKFKVRTNKVICTGTPDSDMACWIDNVTKIAISLIEKISAMHERNIVFGDLSLSNVMINPETLDIRLIDFEGAYEPGVDSFVNQLTPGYFKSSRMKKNTVEFADDYYALGCALLDMVVPNASLIEIQPDYVRKIFSELQQDIGLPNPYIDCVSHLLYGEEISLVKCIDTLKTISTKSMKGIPVVVDQVEKISNFHSDVVERIFDFNLNVIDASQKDRIFPMGSKFSDPMAVDNGILGIAYAWNRINKGIPDELANWIKNKFQCEGHLPGLMNGLSGMAWVLNELGNVNIAASAIQSAGVHRHLFQKMSLGYGAAGYGLSNLYFWSKSRNESYLNEAVRIADVLCDTAVENEHGCAWEDIDSDGGAGVGLWEGASGIALFLLYMYCATLDTRYLRVGEQGLSFDMSCGDASNGTLDFPRRSDNSRRFVYPYLAYGSAGIASVALRYYVVTKCEKYLQLIEDIKPSIAVKYTTAPELFLGLAGLGNYMLDAYEFLNDETYLDLAYRTSHGIKLFEISRSGGSAFPMFSTAKINCDYSSGSAGIALFLHRLTSGGGNFNFMLDEFISEFLRSKLESEKIEMPRAYQ
jgi:serine/threonine protein kinase